MASFHVVKRHIRVSFTYAGEKLRISTGYLDTPDNRRLAQYLCGKIDFELATGTFDLAKQFPKYAKSHNLDVILPGSDSEYPTFRELADQYLAENVHTYSPRYVQTLSHKLDKDINPFLGDLKIDQITPRLINRFQKHLMDRPAATSSGALCPGSVNKIVSSVSKIFKEAGQHHEVANPCRFISRLSDPVGDVFPFSGEDAWKIINEVREDFRDYTLVRFFTGLRTAEVNGLKKKYVDWENGLLLIRETYAKGSWGTPKSTSSYRDLPFVDEVQSALERAFAARPESETVFTGVRGGPLCEPWFTRAVWTPALQRLNIPYRRPYTCRHSYAVWRVQGGDDDFRIARDIGHGDTILVRQRYGRWRPRVASNDGDALKRTLAACKPVEG